MKTHEQILDENKVRTQGSVQTRILLAMRDCELQSRNQAIDECITIVRNAIIEGFPSRHIASVLKTLKPKNETNEPEFTHPDETQD